MGVTNVIEFSAHRSLMWNEHAVSEELELKTPLSIQPTLVLPSREDVTVQPHINGLLIGGILVNKGRRGYSHVVCYQLPYGMYVPNFEVKRMINSCGYELATLDELIAYTLWMKAPETKWGQPILALGTCLTDKDEEPSCATFVGIEKPGLYMQPTRRIYSNWVLLIRVPG
jgi:hypothetical protein